ncbi:MAG: DNA-directed RNA polymerase subunit omega [Saprospiraceae bacterium]|nr:DNA-directed RNA polymerase subunit omega [Saprospiraceae bacterium]
MSDIKNAVQGLEPSASARDIGELLEETDNIYESLAIVTKRAKQISVDLKRELHNKLEEFAVVSDTIEEVHENKEQIEISKFYERLPNPALIATDQYIKGNIHHRYRNEEEHEEDGDK